MYNVKGVVRTQIAKLFWRTLGPHICILAQCMSSSSAQVQPTYSMSVSCYFYIWTNSGTHTQKIILAVNQHWGITAGISPDVEVNGPDSGRGQHPGPGAFTRKKICNVGNDESTENYHQRLRFRSALWSGFAFLSSLIRFYGPQLYWFGSEQTDVFSSKNPLYTTRAAPNYRQGKFIVWTETFTCSSVSLML